MIQLRRREARVVAQLGVADRDPAATVLLLEQDLLHHLVERLVLDPLHLVLRQRLAGLLLLLLHELLVRRCQSVYRMSGAVDRWRPPSSGSPRRGP